ncbi:MAG: response regulator transcription factor [Oscillospiraceae bacterium]|nr:response regulator transcription factor [Oscillospiraceae bacterium]
MRILIIEDEAALADALSQILQKNKYMTDVCYDGQKGLDCALSGIYDLIILDIMLPKINGFDVLRCVRINKITTPVLLLTAKDEIADKVNGLDFGADDYMTKPFNTEELLARIRSLCRRGNGAFYEPVISFCDISLNTSTYEIICSGNSLKLGLKEFNLMELFIKNGTSVLSKEQLIDRVWGYDSDAEYNNVEVYISFLRKKLSHLKSAVTIKTVRGVGYCLSSGD